MIHTATCLGLLLTIALTASVALREDGRGEVPNPAASRVVAPAAGAGPTLVVEIRVDNAPYVDGRKLTIDQLIALVKADVAKRDSTIEIRADRRLRYDQVSPVMFAVSTSGATKMQITALRASKRGGVPCAYKTTDTSLAMVKGEKVIWKFNFDKKEGKPYFHPLCTSDGTLLTALRPKDHPWHRALWFSWKQIDGVNYWEENRQGLSQGLTEIKTVKVLAKEGEATKIDMTLSYHPPEKPVVMTEKLSIVVSLPDAAGVYTITWKTVFTAGEKDVVLDRTPIPGEKGGKGYGGYAGLSLRLAAEQKKWPAVDSEGREDMKIHGQAARWMGFGDKIGGGGIFIEAGKSSFGATPQWYISKGMPYFSPAVLFAKPFTLKAGKSIDMAYTITIYPKKATAPVKAPV